ncbi:hypothetical protein CC78DRAFT_597141 [Lojkania enalia]|uniref:Beta-xylanase n=1 Tax=Lojkania enalia TaxID=147567 RepID=A0A9P4KDP9_9PLEO|nr:hypothetical protein CC78DRAFT_597141 [Didymosphaeria enalia]
MIATTFTFLLVATSIAASPARRQAIDGLNARAIAAGKDYFGSATDNPELTDAAYDGIVIQSKLTPEKWDAIEPSRDTFSFSNGDAITDLAARNGQKVRCHTLVWYSQLPSWVKTGGYNNATLISIMENHITKEVTHYKGKCFHWDVVNEALNEDGTYRSNVFYDTIGPSYIPIAFKAAAAADPSAKLYYNDYNIENLGAKSTRAQNIVKLIKQYGAKIDGVGMQAHLIVGSTPSQSAQVANMNAFVNLGVEVAYTELDIRTNTPATASAVTQQAKDYAATVGACMEVAECVGITIWDYTDKYSWIPSVFPGQGAALPWDQNLKKKDEVYKAILSALGSSSGSPTTTSKASATPIATSAFAPPTSSSAMTNLVPKWNQCGGINYSGPTVCESGTTCTKFNDWYSQCL